jgi:hypothetical protein
MYDIREYIMVTLSTLNISYVDIFGDTKPLLGSISISLRLFINLDPLACSDPGPNATH